MRSEGELDDETIVVRFGLCGLESLRAAVRSCHTALGFYGLSFYGENGMSVDEVALQAQKRHLQMRVSTVGRIKPLGSALVRYGREPHLTLKFSRSPTDDHLRKVQRALDEPVENPHPVD